MSKKDGLGKIARAEGFESLADLARWSGFSARSVQRWYAESPYRFNAAVAGAKVNKQAAGLDTKLPPVKVELHDTERIARPSIDVLVRVDTFASALKGRFFHGLNQWQIDGIHGFYEADRVAEWWFLPDVGTGIKPPTKGVDHE